MVDVLYGHQEMQTALLQLRLYIQMEIHQVDQVGALIQEVDQVERLEMETLQLELLKEVNGELNL